MIKVTGAFRCIGMAEARWKWPAEAEEGRFIDDIASLAETFEASSKKMFMSTEGTDIGAFVIGSFGMSFLRKYCEITS